MPSASSKFVDLDTRVLRGKVYRHYVSLPGAYVLLILHGYEVDTRVSSPHRFHCYLTFFERSPLFRHRYTVKRARIYQAPVGLFPADYLVVNGYWYRLGVICDRIRSRCLLPGFADFWWVGTYE